MKNFITFILYCLSVTALVAQAKSEARVTVLAKSATETTLLFALTDVDRLPVTTPQGPAFVLSMDKGTPLLQAGAPDVPKYATSLLIPGAGNMAVEIVASEYQDFPNVNVAPSKGDLKRIIDPATVPYTYGSLYEHDAFFPGRLADLQQPFVMRDVRGQALWLYPVQYNPMTKVLRIYTSLQVRVYHVGGSGENEMSNAKGRARSRAFEQIYQQTFLNYDASLLDRSGSGAEHLLVIAKDEYLADLEPLITWKRQMGFHTTVVPVSEIGSSASSAIYNVVQQHYNDEGTSYLLLVGDENDIHPEMRADGGLYSCDNCFGYMDGTDHFPEIFVGRFNAANLEQLKIMVNRNLEYEKNPAIDTSLNWFATAMASTSSQGQGIGDDNQADYEQGNEWKTSHLADGYEKVWEFYDGNQGAISPTPGDISADQAGDPQNTQLVNLINNRGVSLYNYCGHGWEQGLVSGNFNTDAVATLRNHGRYPIVVAVACCAGNFTNNNGGDCLGEALQRAGNAATGEAWGGVAGFFSSDFQSWAPPMEGQDGMNQYLIDADGVTITPAIGPMLAVGNAKMIAAYAEGGELMADFWNAFADPTTVPRTRTPQTMIATHQPTTFIGTTSLTVNSPVEGALVSLYWQGQNLAVASVSGGVASLNFEALNNVGEITVTVTQFNYLPYQGQVTVTPASGPFVVNQSVVLDDALLGNNNQLADYGETVAFNVTLANVGLELATAATATLSTTDANVTITDGSETFGDIAQNESVAKTAAFTFKVESDVVDGHLVNFNLHLDYGSGLTYDAVIPVKLQAPLLKVTPYQLTDITGGNGNNRLESGETAVIHINNLNVGHSKSPTALGTLTTDSPWLTLGGTLLLGKIDALTGMAEASFLVQVSPDAPPVVPANFHYSLQAAPYEVSQDFSLTINAILETFETHNFGAYPWIQGGNKPWTITTPIAYTGTYSSRSGSILNNQKSQMSLNLDVVADGSIGFARKVSCESDYDYLYFYIDGVEAAKWTGELDWTEVSFPVTAGQHKFTWSYEKDAIGAQGSDRAWVDDIILPLYQVVVPTQNPDLTSLQMDVSPNPSSGLSWLRLVMPAEQTLSVDLYDALGRRLQTLQNAVRYAAGETMLPIDLSKMAAGVYLVQVRSATEVRTMKVVRQ